MAGRLRFAILLVSLLVWACGAGLGKPTGAPESSLAVETLYLGQQCGETAAQPAAQWLDRQSDYRAVWQRLAGRFASSARPAPPEVDFLDHGVLLLSMGQRPTAGYGLALSTNAAVLEGKTARVAIQWQEPMPGAAVAQVVSSPCLLLRMLRADLAVVRVVDQHNFERFTVPIN